MKSINVRFHRATSFASIKSDTDPNKNPDAVRYDRITYTEALSKRLQVMDSTAFSLCMDNKIPIVVFDMNKPSNFCDLVLGQKIGTLVTE